MAQASCEQRAVPPAKVAVVLHAYQCAGDCEIGSATCTAIVHGKLKNEPKHSAIMRQKSLLETHLNKSGYMSDKWMSSLQAYESLLASRRNEAICLLEIGVQNGGSLETWANYFENCKLIVGIDINNECEYLKYCHSSIKVIIGDSCKEKTRSMVAEASASYDVIMDDGSHEAENIVINFCKYFPLLKNGGCYIIEDLCCAYWPLFGGGLHSTRSPMAFLFCCVHMLNSEHWKTSDIDDYTQALNDFYDFPEAVQVYRREFL